MATGGTSRTALDDFERDNCSRGAGIEKSSSSCPEGGEESCRNCEGFVRVGMTCRVSKQMLMCGSERFHRRFSSIDYDARKGFRKGEFRGEISETLTALAFVFGAAGNRRARLIAACVVRVSLNKPHYAG